VAITRKTAAARADQGAFRQFEVEAVRPSSIAIDDPVGATFDGLAARIDAAGIRSVGFTSALFGEGVSTIALGTALSLAALEQDTVLLVDANWMQPSLTSDAHLDSAPGLADYIANQAELRAIVHSQAPRLAFVPIGDRALSRPTRRAVSSFLSEEASSFRAIVVDLPPVLAGEPSVIAWTSVLDRLFVVLRESATPLAMVRDALEKVAATTTPYIVMNRSAERATPRAATSSGGRP
jgi:Mrp family chromosome partitioning ATPase